MRSERSGAGSSVRGRVAAWRLKGAGRSSPTRALASLAAIFFLAMAPAQAQEKPSGPTPTVPIPPPEPPPRPGDLTPGSPDVAKPALPGPAGESPLPPQRPAELSGEAARTLAPAAPDNTACRRRLERLGVTFEPLPAIANGQCGAQKPLKVSQLADGVAIEPPATLVCGAAEALARWATEVQVAAQTELGQSLRSLAIGTSYQCRGQNHSPDAKLSEHAFANGIDVMGFGFAGRASVGVVRAPDGTPEAAFQAAAQAKACAFFRTVLGPGSDAAHANHLHLDERERNAGHRLCQ